MARGAQPAPRRRGRRAWYSVPRRRTWADRAHGNRGGRSTSSRRSTGTWCPCSKKYSGGRWRSRFTRSRAPSRTWASARSASSTSSARSSAPSTTSRSSPPRSCPERRFPSRAWWRACHRCRRRSVGQTPSGTSRPVCCPPRRASASAPPFSSRSTNSARCGSPATCASKTSQTTRLRPRPPARSRRPRTLTPKGGAQVAVTVGSSGLGADRLLEIVQQGASAAATLALRPGMRLEFINPE